eukprot:scaffold15742_cov228-Alexandrium_tamarense.AAC.1
MPFGPVNGPAIFIIMIHDLKATWDALAQSRGIEVGEDTNCEIIIDDINGRSSSFDTALEYMECQLIVALRERLSLNLRKSSFFRPRFEFVGHDICSDGIRPAQSKHILLKSWPDPAIVRDIASLVGFAQFYSAYIPYLELRISCLRDLMSREYDAPILPEMWTDACAEAWAFIKNSILSDPCLKRYDHRRRFYLKYDFSAFGMGYIGMQPDDDDDSIAAMTREIAGGPCEFLISKDLSAAPRLRPVCMGSRRNKGYEKKLHSYLGEAFALDWAINQCRIQCWGQKFTAIGDCKSLQFIMTYEGKNPVVLRLQMRLMCWWMDLVHRPNSFNVD